MANVFTLKNLHSGDTLLINLEQRVAHDYIYICKVKYKSNSKGSPSLDHSKTGQPVDQLILFHPN